MADRDELKIKIRDAIWDLDSQAHETGHWEDPLTYAEAALTAIEDAGIDLGCQASPGIKGETVSAPAEPLQAKLVAEALDRGLPRHFSLHFCAKENGFLQVYSDDVPEFYISGRNEQSVAADIVPILSRILWENYGTTIAGFCRRQAGETPDTNNPDTDDDG